MNAIDRDAVLIANPGPSPAAGALALVLRLQVAQLPHIQIDERGLAITGGVAQ